jgi:hypothetical protein
MKAIWMAAVFGLPSLTAVRADPIQPQVPPGHVACARPPAGFDRVSYTLPLGPECCAGKLRCTQLLATTIMRRAGRPART